MRCLPSVLKSLIFLVHFCSLLTAIVGPPKLSWLFQGQNLSVNIIMPLTPYRSKTGSYKPVDQVLQKLWYQLSLYEGDVLIQQVRGGAGEAQSAQNLQNFPGTAKTPVPRRTGVVVPVPAVAPATHTAMQAAVRCFAPPVWASQPGGGRRSLSSSRLHE